jgi:hypothetical protein
MIIWINGPFGIGKTQTAFELHYRLTNSFVFDPERVGIMLRRTLPDSLKKGDFQDILLWRELTRDTLVYLNSSYEGHIIVPMTIVVPKYYDEIIGALREHGLSVHHFTLLADQETLIIRLRSRGSRRKSWAVNQIGRCLAALISPMFEIHIDTQNKTIENVAEQIAAVAGVTLAPASAHWWQRKARRWGVVIRYLANNGLFF